MPEIVPSAHIDGVCRVVLTPHADPRGRFVEMFRAEWLPQVSWDRTQMNRSDSVPGILRGLHYHHRQVDYWYVQRGTIRAGLVDLRRDSPTYRGVAVLEMGADAEADFGLFIPVGVAHGFYTLSDVTLTYVVNNYYNGADELGVAWNDPELAVPWEVENPTVSARDATLPLWKDVPEARRPA